MDVRMIEGMLGAGRSVRLANTPMSVYRRACAEGDPERMQRALGYAGGCTEEAERSREKLEEGLEAEARAERKKARLEREAALEARREARRRAEEPDRPPARDLVCISPEAKAVCREERPETGREDPPAVYTASGELAGGAEARVTVSFTA